MLLWLLIPAGLLVYASWRFLRRQKGEQRIERFAMMLRMTEAVLLVLIVSGLCVVTHSDDSQTVILLDRSASMEGMYDESDAAAKDVLDHADERHTAQVLCFAEDAVPQAESTGKGEAVTNIAAALDTAAAQMREDVNRRIILLSDGAATDGDLAKAAKRMLQEGIRVDAVHYDTVVHAPEAEVSELLLPADTAEGERFDAHVTIQANEQMSGMLYIFDGDMLLAQQEAYLKTGKNRISVRLQASGIGEHLLRAEIEMPDDTISENNFRYGFMRVSSSARVLLVDGTGQEAQQLSALLAEGGNAVDVVSGAQLPDTVPALCEYGLIVLMNVDVGDLPEGSAQRLKEYVSVYGRSLLTTGGENTYIYGGMKDTPLEELLPVRMSVEEKESVDPVALMLVIDVTDSMTRQSSGTPIEMARRGAVKCVDSLNANDYAGVITFSDDAQVLVDMTPMADKNEIIEAINGIKTADPDRLTKFSGALKTACETLKSFDKLEKKHVIFITDGSPADAQQGFDGIVKEMRANGITMSTIVVGRIMNVVKLLEGLSSIGGGRCYFVEGASDLPDIMSTDTVLSQVEYTIDAPFIPESGSAVFADGDGEAITQLYGYIRTAAKPGAQTLLRTPEGRPVYVQQVCGKGIAASFMSDLSGQWSRAWFASEKGQAMIKRMIKALTPQTFERAGMSVSFEPGGAWGTLRLENEVQEAAAVAVQILSPDGKNSEAELEWVQDNVYTGLIPVSEPGAYRITLVWQDAQGLELERAETVAVYSWSPEFEMASRAGGPAALMELVSLTGGTVAKTAQELLDVDLGTTATEHDVVLWLSAAVMICLLADITVRKTKLKGLRSRRKTM